MARFTEIRQAHGEPGLQAAFERALAVGLTGTEEGVPENFVTALGSRPDYIHLTCELAQGIAEKGLLPPTVKQLILMAIAMQNDCRYCAIGHSYALEQMGVPTSVVESCARDPEMRELPPPQRAMVKLALKAARDPKSVTDGDVSALRDMGLGEGEIIEVVWTAAFANFANLWADLSGIDVESAWT